MSKLYIVGTPIGNLGDFSERAKKTLENVDFIAAEDTRVTLKLLNHFNIKNTIISLHKHNEIEKSEQIIEKIKAGSSCALVTDAGMPAISDPGEYLVHLCYKKEVPVESVPGPTAVTTALALSGMYTGRFSFEGFLSTNKLSRAEHLNEIKDRRETLVFYEAPHKLLSTLKDMLNVLGDRNLAVIKELTKIHENVMHTSLKEAVEYFAENAPKGEYVLVVEGKEKPEEQTFSLDDAVNLATKLKSEGLPLTEAAKEAAAACGFKKSEIYKMLINNKED